MKILDLSEKLMNMDDAVWQRHANPWSGITRFAAAPLNFLAIWSYVWIDWWALIPISLVALWAYLNPRIFPKPLSTDNWMSKGVFGERVYLNRDNIPIPQHHEVAGKVLTYISLTFILISIGGFVVQDFWIAFTSFHLSIVFKGWFVDRMVWLYEDMKYEDDIYASWLIKQ